MAPCGQKVNGGAKMKGRMNTQLGAVLIDTDVIAKYAGSVAVECFGIVGMASVNMKDGLVKLLKRESLTHGIQVTLNANKITLDFHVIVVYGVNITSVADNLIATVKYKVEGKISSQAAPQSEAPAFPSTNIKNTNAATPQTLRIIVNACFLRLALCSVL